MKSRSLFIQMLAVLLAVPLMGTFARAATNGIEVLETFDYPGAGNLTRPQKTNENADIVGIYLDPSGASRGFIRTDNGHFSPPIVEPNDTGSSTEGRGINNARMICGDYLLSDGTFHGFFLTDGAFTELAIAGAMDTEVLGINNAGDFCGNFIDSSGANRGFISIGGSLTAFRVPGAIANLAYQVNASNQAAGYYVDVAGITHGFFRDSDGALTFPLDPPGSTGTIVFGLNDKDWVVGRYSDSTGATHGFVHIPGHNYVTYDFPGSTFTSLNGINRHGLICGRYLDATGIEHGILAQLTRGGPSAAMSKAKPGNAPSSPARSTTSSVVRGGPPAS